MDIFTSFQQQLSQTCRGWFGGSKRKREDDPTQQAPNNNREHAEPMDKRVKGNPGSRVDDCSGARSQAAAVPSALQQAAAAPVLKQPAQEPAHDLGTPTAATPGPRYVPISSRRTRLPLGGGPAPSLVAPLPDTPATGGRSQALPNSLRKQQKPRPRTDFKKTIMRPMPEVPSCYKFAASRLDAGRAASSSPGVACHTPLVGIAATAGRGFSNGGSGAIGRQSVGGGAAYSSLGASPAGFSFQAHLQREQQRGGSQPEPSTPTFQQYGAATPAPPAQGDRDVTKAAAVAAAAASRQQGPFRGWQDSLQPESGGQRLGDQQQQQQVVVVQPMRRQAPLSPAAAVAPGWGSSGGDQVANVMAGLDTVAFPSSSSWPAAATPARDHLAQESRRAEGAWEQAKQSWRRPVSSKAGGAAAGSSGVGRDGPSGTSAMPGLSPEYHATREAPALLAKGLADHLAQLKKQEQQLKSRLVPRTAQQPPATDDRRQQGKGQRGRRAAPARQQGRRKQEEEEDEVVLLTSSDEEEAPGQQQEEEDEEAAEPSSLLEEEEYEEDEEESEGEEGAETEEVEEGLEALGLTAGRWEPTQEEVALWRGAIAPGPPAEVLAKHPRAGPLPREKMACLERGRWLNDEVINFYVSLLLDRDKAMRTAVEAGSSSSSKGRPPPRCHFFTTFFLNKLFKDTGAYDYANVRRWTTKAKLTRIGQAAGCVLECDLLLVLVHESSHWTCAAIDLRPDQRCLVYYDSLGGTNPEVLAHLAHWVQDEAKDKLGQEWDTSTWPRRYPKDIPRQTNGCDCGVFALLYANRLSLGAGWDFSQQDLLVNARVRVACELVEGQLRDMGPAAGAAGGGTAAAAASNGNAG